MKEIIQKNGKYYKECDIIMLPTKDDSNIYLYKNIELVCKQRKHVEGNRTYINQHLYLLSNEQINEGDYYLDKEDKLIFKCFDKQEAKARNDNREIYEEERWFKIIATTNTTLRVLEHEFSSKTIELLKLSEDFIKKYVESNGSIKKVLVEYEGVEGIIEQRINTIHTFEYKIKLNPDNTINILIEDSVEEAAKQYFPNENNDSYQMRRGFIKGAEWQKNQLNN